MGCRPQLLEGAAPLARARPSPKNPAMLVDPKFEVPCPNPECHGALGMTRAQPRAGTMACAARGATVNLEGEAANISAALDQIEDALKGLGFKE
jgi:hypothetical protein